MAVMLLPRMAKEVLPPDPTDSLTANRDTANGDTGTLLDSCRQQAHCSNPLGQLPLSAKGKPPLQRSRTGLGSGYLQRH